MNDSAQTSRAEVKSSRRQQILEALASQLEQHPGEEKAHF